MARRHERYNVNLGNSSEEGEGDDHQPLLFKPPPNDPAGDEDGPPVDRFHTVYITCFIIGMGGLLPWNMIITATDYFKFKFRDPSHDNIGNATETILQTSFESYFSVATSVVQIVCLILNTAMVHLISLNKRMITSVVLIILAFIITTVLVQVNTDSLVTEFFGVTMALVVVLAASAAIFIGGTFGFCGCLPPIYTQAAMAGQGLAGTFCSGASIVTLAVGDHLMTSALIYFIIGDVMLIVSAVLYLVLQKMKFYTYYHRREVTAALSKQKILYDSHNRRRSSLAIIVASYSPIATIFRKIAFPAFSVCLVFFVTLSMFPAIGSKVIPLHPSNSQWSQKYFTPVMCFLVFNVTDFIGRLSAGFVQFPSNKKNLLVVSVARFVFVPLILLCSLRHQHALLPVVFQHDGFFGLFIGLLGISNGYVSSIAMMMAPKLVEEKDAETAGVAMCLFISIGLGLGSVASLGLDAML